MPRPTYICKGCERRTTLRSRLCPTCTREVHTGLYGGEWVTRGGIKVWVPDEPVEMTPGRERLLKIGHTRYTWHGLRDPATERLECEYQVWRRQLRRERAEEVA